MGHQGWRNARHLKPDVGFPPSRYTMLHTLAHLLVRELAPECGYNAASIRERVYASSDPEAPMAGILLYRRCRFGRYARASVTSANPTSWVGYSTKRSNEPPSARQTLCVPSTIRAGPLAPCSRLPFVHVRLRDLV